MSQPRPDNLETWIERLAASDRNTVEEAVDHLKAGLRGLPEAEYRGAVEALTSLFYVDTADRPDLETALEHAADVLAAEGDRVVPILLSRMEGSDIKSHLFLARTLGKIGSQAVPRLRDSLATADDPYTRAFVLYALGKMTCPEVADALPEVVGGLMHPDKEVRDSAARTLGKIARAVPADRLTPRRRQEMFDALMRVTRDPQPAVRAKAMRSLGKMAEVGLLDGEQREALVLAAKAALGEGADYVWDHAFIVRQEAKEALRAATTR